MKGSAQLLVSLCVVAVLMMMIMTQWNTRLLYAVFTPTPVNIRCFQRLYDVTRPRDVEAMTSDCPERRQNSMTSNNSSPLTHVFFLKTHKTGSTTLTTILNRYALVHNLTVAIREVLMDHAAEKTQNWLRHYRPLPPGLSHFDMLTDHVIFNETCVRLLLPSDTQFISIVREPLSNFVSALYYFGKAKVRSLRAVSADDPVKTYLSNMDKWDKHVGAYLHSRMLRDFGLEASTLRQPARLQQALRNLTQTFHLVLITEHFDESMVLLKRHLRWTLKDVLYVKVNTAKKKYTLNITEQDRRVFEQHRQEEYALYRHFKAIFDHKVQREGPSFPLEVDVFKRMRTEVESFCGKKSLADLLVPRTDFSDAFSVTREDCRLLTRMSSSVSDTWFEKIMLERIKRLSERNREKERPGERAE